MSDAAQIAERKSRLMITKMVLENFKSYAGCQEIGPFHKRFSSVVGPNGSGKSNVIDALLFVFGKRAAQLRLKNVSELIHKSSNFSNLEFAKVSVHFQLIYDVENSDDAYEVVDGSQFVITRTATKNNQSKYFVDDFTSTFVDVAMLLTKHGIDLDNNRFLILQGEVEQIAMMKPKGATSTDVGLLEYLEDIIGSNKFIERIEEAQKSLDEKNDLRTANVNRLKIAEKERDNLYGSKKEAEDFMALESDLRTKKNSLYQSFENDANKKVVEFTERHLKAVEKLNYEQNKASEAEAKLAIFQKDYETNNAEYVAIQNEEQNFSAKYDAFQRKDVKLQEDMKHSKTQIKKHQASVDKETKKEADSMEEAESARAQIEKYTQAVSDFLRKKNDEEAKLDALMETLNGSTAELRMALDTAQSRLAEAEKSVSSQQTEKESTLTAIALLHSRTAENAKRLTQSKEKLANILAEREKSHTRIVSMEGQGLVSLKNKISELEDGIRRLEAMEVTLQDSIRAAITAAEEARAALSMQQSTKGNGGNGAVDKIMNATKKGGALAKVTGIRGRLGDLGTISPQYDAAVSTASSSFDCIVVDNNEVAQLCVNFLRDNNLGRASFMMTSQMDEWKQKMKRTVQTPLGSQRLFDLVQVEDASISPSFYLALRDTLVVSDLDTAVRIAYVGDRCMWRVVTQDGNLIDTTGTMSGGGKVVKTGSMRLSSAGGKAKPTAFSVAGEGEEEVTAAVVAHMDLQVSELQTRLSECRATKLSSESELKCLRKQLKDVSTEVEKGRLLINRLNEQEGELVNRMRDLAAQAELTPQEAEEVDRQHARLVELERDMLDISPFQKEVASLQRQIRSVGGPQLVAAQQRVDSMATQLEKVSSQLSTKQVDETGARKQAEKSAAARITAEAELRKTEQRLQALVLEQQEMEADAGVVVAALEESRERLAAMEEGLKSISAEYSALKALVAKVRAVEVDLEVEVERIAVEIKESSDVAKKYHKDSAAVRKQHLEEQVEFNAVIRSVAMPPRPSFPLSESVDLHAPSTDTLEEPMVKELPVLSTSELESLDQEGIKRDINLIEAEKNKLKSSVNMSALLEYLKKDANYKSRLYELEVVTEERNRVRRDYDDLRRLRLEAFMGGFGVISLKLKEMYQMITLGGDAELELLDSLDPFSEGIVFSVRPPKKSWKNISNLSGGEKTLSSLALVFALHHFKPTPLYVMDEIDAALDFKNVSIVANYIKDRTKDAQFIIISLRNNMFELADRLVGIYKTQDATKSVSINPKMFVKATNGVKKA